MLLCITDWQAYKKTRGGICSEFDRSLLVFFCKSKPSFVVWIILDSTYVFVCSAAHTTIYVETAFLLCLNVRVTDYHYKSFFKRLPGVGSEPGSSRIHLFSHFSPLYRWATAAPHINHFWGGGVDKCILWLSFARWQSALLLTGVPRGQLAMRVRAGDVDEGEARHRVGHRQVDIEWISISAEKFSDSLLSFIGFSD
jgi:hypothetical protein